MFACCKCYNSIIFFIISYAICWWDTHRIWFALQWLIIFLVAYTVINCRLVTWHCGNLSKSHCIPIWPKSHPLFCFLLFKRDRILLSRGEGSRYIKCIQLLLILLPLKFTGVREVIMNFQWDFLRKKSSGFHKSFICKWIALSLLPLSLASG